MNTDPPEPGENKGQVANAMEYMHGSGNDRNRIDPYELERAILVKAAHDLENALCCIGPATRAQMKMSCFVDLVSSLHVWRQGTMKVSGRDK